MFGFVTGGGVANPLENPSPGPVPAPGETLARSTSCVIDPAPCDAEHRAELGNVAQAAGAQARIAVGDRSGADDADGDSRAGVARRIGACVVERVRDLLG